MPNPVPPFRTFGVITDRAGRPTPEFTRWIESLMDAIDRAGTVGQSNTSEADISPVAVSMATVTTLAPVNAETPTMEALTPV